MTQLNDGSLALTLSEDDAGEQKGAKMTSVNTASQHNSISPSELEERQRAQEEKAARMLEIYANERFRSPGSAQKMRLRLVSWVIRNKLKENVKRAFDFVLALIALAVLANHARYGRCCAFGFTGSHYLPARSRWKVG